VFDASKPDLLALLLRADIYQCQGDIQRAVSDYNEAILLEPTDALIRLDLARLLKQTEQYDKAVTAVSKLLEAERDNVTARIVRADLYNATGEYEKAIADASRAIQFDARNEDAYLERGRANLRLKKYNQAETDLTQGLNLNPAERNTWLNRSLAFAGQRKYKEAVADLLQASKLEPKTADPFNSLAWLLATCPDSTIRDGSKAAEYINQALQLGPDRWILWDTRAAVFAENGDFKEAVNWQERCLERKDLPETERRRATERLALYRAGKPYREEPP
jgi:tetratricopeptide (TPR) repeat protein